MLKAGDRAPEIRVHTDTGEDFKLSDLKGKRVVLYFYPRADTPGCTVEACEFRDGIRSFAGKGAAVVGVSRIRAQAVQTEVRPSFHVAGR
jgi:peroxiredoxin Q/BCP